MGNTNKLNKFEIPSDSISKKESLDEIDVLFKSLRFNKDYSRIPKDKSLYKIKQSSIKESSNMENHITKTYLVDLCGNIIISNISRHKQFYTDINIYSSLFNPINNFVIEEFNINNPSLDEIRLKSSLLIIQKFYKDNIYKNYLKTKQIEEHYDILLENKETKQTSKQQAEIKLSKDNIIQTASQDNQLNPIERSKHFTSSQILNNFKILNSSDSDQIKERAKDKTVSFKKKQVEFRQSNVTIPNTKIETITELNNKHNESHTNLNSKFKHVEIQAKKDSDNKSKTSSKNKYTKKLSVKQEPHQMINHLKKESTIEKSKSKFDSKSKLKSIGSSVDKKKKTGSKKSNLHVNFVNEEQYKYTISIDLKDIVVHPKEDNHMKRNEIFKKTNSMKHRNDDEIYNIKNHGLVTNFTNNFQKYLLSTVINSSQTAEPTDSANASSIQGGKGNAKIQSRKDNLFKLTSGITHIKEDSNHQRTYSKKMSLKNYMQKQVNNLAKHELTNQEIDLTTLKENMDLLNSIGKNKDTHEVFLSNLQALEKLKRDNKFLFA